MQLEQTVNQELLNAYIGGEVVIEHDRSLTKGTIVSVSFKGHMIEVSLKDTSAKTGSFGSADTGKWSRINPQTTSVLLSQEIKSIQAGVLTLKPTLRETAAQLTPRRR